jgi:HK97 family phage prohead protease
MSSRKMQNKSWSTLEIKSFDEETRIIRGIASTPSTDRSGDVVVPEGAIMNIPLPFLAGHDHASPIGQVTSARVTKSGIEITAEIAKNSGLAYVEKAWLQIKSGLVRGLSIGFRALKSEPIKGTRGSRFSSYEIIEISAVCIPCQSEASILSVKKFDLLAAQFGQDVGESIGQVKLDEVSTPRLDHARSIIKKWSSK